MELGFPVSTVRTTSDANLHVAADGRAIQPIPDSEDRYVFLVPAGVRSVSLVSRFCIPSDKMISDQRDTRRLGVRVNWLSIRSHDSETIFAADHPALQAGWNTVENDPGSMWRWTDGNALIPWNKAISSAILTVRCTPVDEYPIYDAKLRLVA
ncbi:hypothetical protein [Rhodopila sp.]|uniref:hypothetical protein n=1 Tax=Rhodopila sp. TaxID=2480087 RepID=UPI003D0AE7CC